MTKNLVALAVLGVLVVVAFLVFREEAPEDIQKAKLAIVPVPGDRLDTIQIKRRDKKDGQNVAEEIVLKKIKDSWRMTKPVDYPILESAAKRMVETLGELKVVDVISDNKDKHGDFQVDEEGGIEVTALQGNTALAQLIFGKSKSNMTFVRKPDGDAVYRIQGYHRSAFDRSAENLRDKTIFKVDNDKIKKVSFKHRDGELAFEFTGEGNERSLGPLGVKIQNFNETKAKGIVRTLSSLSARGFVDEPLPPEKTGLGEDAAKVVLELAEPGEDNARSLWIGKEDAEKKQTYVKASTGDQIFTISSATAERLLAKADDFARTDEDMKKEEERRKKAAEAAARGGNQPPGMGGVGNQQIPPELMRQIQAQMAKNPKK